MPISIFSEDLTINGNIESASDIEIKGRVIGDIDAASVEIAMSGNVEGKLSAKNVQIHGSLKGSLIAVSVTIHSQAVIAASITAEEIATENGSRISGKINVTGAKAT